MSKYIIDVGEGYIRHGLERTLTIPVRINEHEDHWMDTRIPVTPYTEPDLEQVRREEYEKGFDAGRMLNRGKYEKGLNDAWEAARKISMAEINGRCSWKSMKNIFGIDIPSKIFKNFTASESIEKLKAYEQEKEEWLRVGDEVEGGDEKYIVLQKYLNNIDELMVVLFNRRNEEIGTWHLYNGNGAIFKKTGRHFPEIAEVLKKMREE